MGILVWFHKHYCLQVTNSMMKISDISNSISGAISQRCLCQYPSSFIVNGRLFCGENKNDVIFQSHFLTTDLKTPEEIRNLTQQWVLTKPLVRINNKMYQFDPYCSVAVEELGETTCDAISPTEAETDEVALRFTLLEIASIAIMAVLLVVVIVAFAVIAYLAVKIHKRYT